MDECKQIELERERIRINRQFKKVFAGKDGKEVLNIILNTYCLRKEPAFIPGSPAGVTESRSGQQQAGILIESMLAVDEDKILAVIKQLEDMETGELSPLDQ